MIRYVIPIIGVIAITIICCLCISRGQNQLITHVAFATIGIICGYAFGKIKKPRENEEAPKPD